MSGFRENLAMMNLAMELFSGQTGNISKVDYDPQKTASPQFPPEDTSFFERVSPESVGIRSEHVSAFVKELSDCKKAAPHHLICLRHGKVFLECTWKPYVKGVMHIEHSLAKSITALAVGMLIDDGRLSVDTKLTEIFGSEIAFLNSVKFKNIAVSHLLTMTSGVSFNEGGAISGNDWKNAYFDSPLSFNTGTKFEYNSMNSYMLSAIVTKITGMPMDVFLKDRLFDPLEISDFLWERCPRGITKGGWGLFMKAEDVAKIGQLYLNEGLFNGKRIVSQEWILDSVKKHVSTGRPDGLDYGYQVWIDEKNGSCLFNGMLQQNCFIFKDKDLVIVTNSGSDELMTLSNVARIVNSYFGDGNEFGSALTEDERSYESLKSLALSAGKRHAHNPIKKGGWKRIGMPDAGLRNRILKEIDGNVYVLENKTEGLMPLFMQMTHNNFTDGLSEISFERERDGLYIHLKEGGEIHHLPAGFDKDSYSTLDFKGEKYLIACFLRFSCDEDSNPCLVVEISFIEEACKRIIKVFFKDAEKRIRLELSENPGEDVIMTALNSISDMEGGIIMNKIKEIGAIEVFNRAALTKISPVVRGELVEEFNEIGENVLWAKP